ncbi:unnamed protein product [Caenorhabditis angaria]|uniref:C2H2-type domain-containing protein n=1 Tax=Caenorhabditis angaria TaxID=860376 RepID=A0A9P1MUP8_9PELO|nr:unnamed protein product [Caenorhabditis angaria]
MSYEDLQPVKFEPQYLQRPTFQTQPLSHYETPPPAQISTPLSMPHIMYENYTYLQPPIEYLGQTPHYQTAGYPENTHTNLTNCPDTTASPMVMTTPLNHNIESKPVAFLPSASKSAVPSTPKNNGTSNKRKLSMISNGTSNDLDSDELSEEVTNHWMPMTWIERSSDNAQVFNFVCLWDQCVDPTPTKQELMSHVYSHVDDLAGSLQYDQNTVCCRVRGCKKVLSGIEELRRHVTMHIFQADCQQKGAEALCEKEEYSCVECCGFELNTNVHYDGEVLLCQWSDCGIPFTSISDLFDHVIAHVDHMHDIDKVEHVNETGDKRIVFPCRWYNCYQFADSKANLKRHIRHHSGEKLFACPFCAKFFSRKDKLYDHCMRRTIILNETEEPYVCKLCQKGFGTEKALCMHVTRHVMTHSCPLCGLGVSRRADLHRHLMLKHSSRTRDHKCDGCPRKFFSESELARHAVMHTDTMYNCKFCPEKFKWKKQLLKHLKEHDENYNPTPYVCHLCEKNYSAGFALSRHLTHQHHYAVPYGFSRFTYKKCADGLMRLQTKKLYANEDE